MKSYLGILIVGVFILTSCGGKKKTVGKSHNIQAKYASLLEVDKSAIKNIKLYAFIDEWYGVKYKYGGTSKSGVDCSGFCNQLYRNVYSKQLKRSAKDIAKQTKRVGLRNLKEGDLVFFNISGKNSHVGVYLMNNRFVHASTSKGVIISNLTNSYYKKAFNKGGRL